MMNNKITFAVGAAFIATLLCFGPAMAAYNPATVAVPPSIVVTTPYPLSPTISVTWFGAKCDGTTDDTAAFQTALNAGGTVTLPYKSVCVVQPLTLSTDGTALNLNAGTLKLKVAATGVCPAGPISGWAVFGLWCGPLLTVGSPTSDTLSIKRVLIENGTLDGNSATQPVGLSQDGVNNAGGTFLTVQGVHFKNFTRDGILNANVPYNTTNAISTPGAGVKFVNNTFDGSPDCIHFEGGMNDSIISNNVCNNATDSAFSIFDTSELIISQNACYNSGTYGCFYQQFGSENVYSNNFCNNSTGTNGCYIINSQSNTLTGNAVVGTAGPGFWLAGSYNTLVGSIIIGDTPGTDNTMSAILIKKFASPFDIAVIGNTISGNTIQSSVKSWKYGIDLFNGDPTGTVVSGNFFTNQGTRPLNNPSNLSIVGNFPWNLSAQTLGDGADLLDLWDFAGAVKLFAIDANGTPKLSDVPGVTCAPGAPTGSFAVTQGIVTHC